MEDLASAPRGLLSIMAIIIAITPWIVDYNETHIFNPHWPPHAKYHNAQTLNLAAVSGVIALGLLWWPASGEVAVLRFDMAVLFVTLYWICALPGILLPGTAYEDPQYPDRLPVLFGMALNQTRVGTAWLIIAGLLWWIERGRLGAS